MNDFCIKDCTGGDIKEIKECDDYYCPFYKFRYFNLEYQNRRKKDERQKDK